MAFNKGRERFRGKPLKTRASVATHDYYFMNRKNLIRLKNKVRSNLEKRE